MTQLLFSFVLFKYKRLFRCLHFSSGGDCLYAAGADILRTYLWEPARTISSQHIPWGMIQDIVAVNNKLVKLLELKSCFIEYLIIYIFIDVKTKTFFF
jgi:hypothetical protein